MRIQKLELFGFKSFPDRTVFEFGSGISCVVGPNGSGKSNVVDALRWCIGEQSARSLRGAEMSDVIFAGSAARSPVGFAEVTLTLSSAGGEPFPGDFARFEELEVGRRLYRDGTSEYLINRVKCRRRDIVDLFLDTGVGANLYSFIAQGQVDRIVSQSANDRRSLIDEAAGITRYKARREEAMARLAATAAQLDRAADVSDEMGKRIRSLERQVLKAGRFRRARARIKQREILLGVVKYGALADDRRALRETLRHTRDESGALKRSVERLGRELSTRTAEVESVREALAQWREEAAELEAQRREAEGAAALHRDRHSELVAAIERATARVERSTRAVEEATARRDGLQAERTQLKRASADAPLAELTAARDAALAAVGEARAHRDALRRAEDQREERLRSLQEELDRIDARQLGLESEPLAEIAPLEGPALSTLEEALSDEMDQLEQARSTLADVRQVLAEAVRRAEDENRAHQQRLSQWERQRSEHDRSAKRVRRWHESTRSAERRRREVRLSEARAGVRERGGRWTRALEEEHREQSRAVELEHRSAIEADKAALVRRRAELADGEKRAIASLKIDETELSAARQEAIAARAAAEEAESTRRTAVEEHGASSGRLRALEGEFRTLEEARAATIPDAWSERPLAVDVLDEDDPRRWARPELLGLPVIEPDALLTARGRGVIADVRSDWRRVETVSELVRVARAGPVGLADGSLRIDTDGAVLVDAVDRWAEVRDALMAARQAVSACDVTLERAKRDDLGARARVSAAGEAVERLEVEVRAAREAAVQQTRAEFSERLAAIEQAHDGAERSRNARRDARLRELQEAFTAARRAAAAGVEEALGHCTAPMPAAPFLRLAAGVAWPAPLPSRPTPVEGEDRTPLRRDVSDRETAVDALEQRMQGSRLRVEERRRAEDRRARTLAERDAARASREAERARLGVRRSQIVAEVEVSVADPRLPLATEALEDAERASRAASEQLRQVEAEGATRRERLAAIGASLEQVEREVANAQTVASESRLEIDTNTTSADEALQRAEASRTAGTEIAVQRGEVMERVQREKHRLTRLEAEEKAVRDDLAASRERSVRSEAEVAELDQRVQGLQLDIEALRKRLGDRYQVSLPGLLDRLLMRRRLVVEADPEVEAALTIGEVTLEGVTDLSIGIGFADDADAITEMVGEVETLRAEIQRYGEVNLAAEGEYLELDTRYRELLTQTVDLEESVKSIRSAIAKMNRTCRERFRDAYDRVNEAFQVAYPQLVGGGDARLALTDEEDLLQTGVDIFVRPPGKRLQNLTLLSGGEKAMTAIALLLALFQVKPSPFCVLDEVDAPLDEANGARFNDMVRAMSKLSQFIVITHNRKTMECADVLYGVTMAKPGVSTLVSVALDSARPG